MRKITKFPKLVVDEAKNLKKYATPQEIAQLNIEELNPTSGSYCVYGQIAGNCYTTRAVELIKKCAKRVYHAEYDTNPGKCRRLNGDPKKIQINNRYGENVFWSPIEVFIDRAPKEMGAKLVAFLKGERKRLV